MFNNKFNLLGKTTFEVKTQELEEVNSQDVYGNLDKLQQVLIKLNAIISPTKEQNELIDWRGNKDNTKWGNSPNKLQRMLKKVGTGKFYANPSDVENLIINDKYANQMEKETKMLISNTKNPKILINQAIELVNKIQNQLMKNE